MEAPVYPPATAFVAPRRLPWALNTRDAAITELRRDPAAWAIVLRHVPTIEGRVGSDQIKPYLDNLSLRSMVQYGIVDAADLDRIDAALASSQGRAR